MSYLNSDKMLGRIQARETTTGTLTVRKDGGRYLAELGGHTFHAERLNVSGAAAALEHNSLLEFGGDKEKSVTITVTPANDTYMYVEVDA